MTFTFVKIVPVLLLSSLALAGDIYWQESCNFPSTDCGIENQPIMGSYFEPAYTYIGSNYEKVVILDSRHAGSSAARLITPYIRSTWKQAVCLSLDYKIEGDGIEKLTVIQQDRHSTKIIYQVEEDDKKGKWRSAKMDILLRGGIIRYFVEARVDKRKTGLLMIRSLEYREGKCKPEYNRSALFSRRSRLLNRYWDLYNY